jgi:hypothetical protein
MHLHTRGKLSTSHGEAFGSVRMSEELSRWLSTQLTRALGLTIPYPALQNHTLKCISDISRLLTRFFAGFFQIPSTSHSPIRVVLPALAADEALLWHPSEGRAQRSIPLGNQACSPLNEISLLLELPSMMSIMKSSLPRRTIPNSAAIFRSKIAPDLQSLPTIRTLQHGVPAGSLRSPLRGQARLHRQAF